MVCTKLSSDVTGFTELRDIHGDLIKFLVPQFVHGETFLLNLQRNTRMANL